MTDASNPRAFPGGKDPWDGKPYPGMTLLDWFAGQALNGSLSLPNIDDTNHSALATFCYDMADAMLAERERRRG